MEVARVEVPDGQLSAEGTQLGATYELRYRLRPSTLTVDIVGERSLELELGDADFFDLGLSPLFNSLPVLRDGLLTSSSARTYEMRWVDVPSLRVERSEQQYEPLGGNVVRFAAGTFSAEIVFDDAGFVVHYPGLARRVFSEPSTTDMR
jgi:uncharacterized protein